jgi:two-component system cell cycle sensor histidine kinase/response regulator CckA
MVGWWRSLEKRFLPVYVWDSDPLTFWRERILFIICFLASTLGVFALIPSLALAFFEARWDIIILDSFAYLTILTVLLSRRLSLKIRAWAVCLVLYFLGVGLLFMLGPHGAGYIWLFGASVMVGAIVGLRASLWSLLLNLIALLAVGAFIVGGSPYWAEHIENAIEKWLVMTVNFLLINAFVTVTTAVMLEGLKNALLKEREISSNLRQSEERFRLIVENLPILIVGFNGNDRVALWNKECEKVTGYTADEIIDNADALKMFTTKIRETFIAEDAFMQDHKTFRNREIEIICKNGLSRTIAWTDVSHIVSAPGLKSWLVGIDVTERNRYENELQDSKERYRLIFDNATEGIFVIQDGRIRFINHRTLEMLGLDHSDLWRKSGDTFLDYIHIEDRETVTKRYFNRMIGEELPSTYSIRLVRPDGSLFWVDISPVVIQWEGRPATMAFMTDISDRIRAEQEKQTLEAQLRQAQKMEAVGTLAGGVAHDFNNLLQVINGYAQILLMDKTEQDREFNGIKAIKDAGARAAKLVRQLLLFSRKAETERKAVDLNAEIRQAVKILERTIPKMVEIELRLHNSLWAVNVDPIQIEQVLLNLGTNASDAMPDGGKLIITTHNIILDDDFLQSHMEASPGKNVLVTVTDTGQGMDAETLEHIFEPFYTTKEIGKGTGLGLASVYGIVKGHGGFVTCRSRPGQGTVFQIYLPAVEKHDAQFSGQMDDEPVQGGYEKILIVDDEQSVRDFASQVLQRYGYTVLTASSGEQAVDLYSRQNKEIDLIVLDIGMPGMGGHKCMLEILRIAPNAKIVIASGYAVDGPVQKTLEQGASGFIGKPYHMEDMLKTVRRVLNDSLPAHSEN